MKYIMELEDVNLSHTSIVGGKNASTGEMIQALSDKGIKIPKGFATTADAYRNFLAYNNLDKKIAKLIASINFKNLKQLNKTSQQIRRLIIAASFSIEFKKEIAKAYSNLKNISVAVRSSATAEDLASASFAGAQETYLNVKGLKNLLRAIKLVYASLFTSRAIAYRHDEKFSDMEIALSVGVQPMVRSDKGVSGVIFTIDTETGFDKVVLVTASYGLGETIVQGRVIPDQFYLYKPLVEKNSFSILERKLGKKKIKMVYTKNMHSAIKTVNVNKKEQSQFCVNDNDIQLLARQALIIEKHYGRPMDIEWAKDGVTNQIYILQARPETVKSQQAKAKTIERLVLSKKGKILAEGESIGQGIGSGKARIILNPKKIRALKKGDVLVADMTDPDWEPIMTTASAIVTNRGGRTCHAAIVARELGIPAIVGCVDATSKIKENQVITVSCADGHIGHVYEGKIPYKSHKISLEKIPKLPVNLCINVGNPEKAFANQFLPNEGVGLARLEFIIAHIGVHPGAVLNFKKLPKLLKKQILEKASAYKNPLEFYIEKLREGISMIAAAFFPKQVIFRFSDFKSNEYANLLGGKLFEIAEENPMIGFRGASRYAHATFRESFKLECIAFKRVRDEMGLTNAQLMIPFVRTVSELRSVIAEMKENGLVRGENNLKIYMMCEIPSNVILAQEFLKDVDGYSIGSNDITQLILGLDRDSNMVASIFDEQNEAVKKMLHQVITECKQQGKYIGICGQAPSDYPEFANWLVEEGIDSISLNPDSVVETWGMLANKFKKK